MSWKPQQLVEGEWCDNALRFATHEEAHANARDLFHRWTVPNDYRAIYADDDPVNYRYVAGQLVAVDKE
jgi:hypothetical protein